MSGVGGRRADGGTCLVWPRRGGGCSAGRRLPRRFASGTGVLIILAAHRAALQKRHPSTFHRSHSGATEEAPKHISPVIDRRYNKEPMRKPRLRRLDWVFSPTAIYFLTACTHSRADWLACPEIHKSFVAFSSRATDRGAFVGRYVLMPDHLHLFVSLRPGSLRLSAWMKSLKNTLSKTLRVMGKRAPHWQDGFFDHILRSSESYEEKWVYVRANPVRAGLVSQADDWPYQGEIHRLRL